MSIEVRAEHISKNDENLTIKPGMTLETEFVK